MMKYEKLNHNFIPKEEKSIALLDMKTLKEKNQVLMDKNMELLSTIEKYKYDIKTLKEELNNKQQKPIIAKNTVESSEEKDIKKKLNEIESFKAKIDTLNNEVQGLNKENAILKEDLQSYQQHIQMLYLLLLIIVIL